MAEMGYCPSGRLFEAAACGAPLLTDWWDGLTDFFEPGSEILVAGNSAEVAAALEWSDQNLIRLGQAARDRVLSQHTAGHRAVQLVANLESALSVGA
jgi:spore maturation protein CgeB